MKRAIPVLMLVYTVLMATTIAQAMPAAVQNRVLTDAALVQPLSGPYKRCGGACLKSGQLSWFCSRQQDCYLSCASAPAAMKCAVD